MAAITKLFGSSAPEITPEPREGRGHALAKLKILHAEAEETARLANLLGRSLYAALAMPVLAIMTIALAVAEAPGAQIVWLGFVGLIAAAMLMSYRHAMREPFARNSLKHFAKDLSAILLFAGFAWGSGAFLALPTEAPAVAVIAFAFLPAGLIAYLLRDREALLLFLTPVTALSAAAASIKPFAGAATLSVALLALGAAMAGAAFLYARLTGERNKPAMLSMP